MIIRDDLQFGHFSGEGVLQFQTIVSFNCLAQLRQDRTGHLEKKSIFWRALLMIVLMLMAKKETLKTFRSSLNCLFAFSWFSSSGVCNNNFIFQYIPRGLQNILRGLQKVLRDLQNILRSLQNILTSLQKLIN